MLAYYEIHSARKNEEFTYTLSGFSANPTDDDKCSFLWFSIPEVSISGHQFLNDVSTNEHGIEFRSHPSNVLTLNLMDPSQPWIRSYEYTSSTFQSLIIGKCTQTFYPLAFNEFQKYQIKEDCVDVIAITDKQNTQRTGQIKSLNRMIQNCAMIKDDLYFIRR